MLFEMAHNHIGCVSSALTTLLEAPIFIHGLLPVKIFKFDVLVGCDAVPSLFLANYYNTSNNDAFC